jgi:hypothetical protein
MPLATSPPPGSHSGMRDRLPRASILILLVVLAVTFIVATAEKSELPDEIRRVEGVALVERLVSPQHPLCRIVHIADFHMISRDDFGAYLREQTPGISDAEVENDFQDLKSTVRQIQTRQLRLIRWLAKEHAVRVVHREGLTDSTREFYATMVRRVREGKLDPGLIGAAGQALIAGDIVVVAPADEESPYLRPDPFNTGRFKLDGPANDAREEAIVRRLASKGPLSVIVLGVEHDLSKHVEKRGDCEYLKVYVEGFEN